MLAKIKMMMIFQYFLNTVFMNLFIAKYTKIRTRLPKKKKPVTSKGFRATANYSSAKPARRSADPIIFNLQGECPRSSKEAIRVC